MATIDSNGVLFYQDTDNYTPIQTALNLAQSNLSNLLGGKPRFERTANTGTRASLVASIGAGNISKANPLIVWRADAPVGMQFEYTVDAVNWHYVVTTQTPTSTHVLATGTVNITAYKSFKTVTIYVNIATLTGMTDNVVSLNGGNWIIPAELRPLTEVLGAGNSNQPGVTFHAATILARPDGTIAIIKPTVATEGIVGSVTYVIA